MFKPYPSHVVPLVYPGLFCFALLLGGWLLGGWVWYTHDGWCYKMVLCRQTEILVGCRREKNDDVSNPFGANFFSTKYPYFVGNRGLSFQQSIHILLQIEFCAG